MNTTEKLRQIVETLETISVESLTKDDTLTLIENGKLLAKIKGRALKLYTGISRGTLKVTR